MEWPPSLLSHREHLVQPFFYIWCKASYFQTFIDGKRVFKVENKKPEVFYNVKVYAASPWDAATKGKIRHLEIYNIGNK